MAVAESIFTKLSTAGSATAAIVGTGDACRVYAEYKSGPTSPEPPYAIMNEIAATGVPTHREAVGVTHRLLQFSCYATTFLGARALRDAIISDLDNATLSNGDNPTLQDERSTYEPAVDLFRADADFLV